MSKRLQAASEIQPGNCPGSSVLPGMEGPLIKPSTPRLPPTLDRDHHYLGLDAGGTTSCPNAVAWPQAPQALGPRHVDKATHHICGWLEAALGPSCDPQPWRSGCPHTWGSVLSHPMPAAPCFWRSSPSPPVSAMSPCHPVQAMPFLGSSCPMPEARPFSWFT
nr:unnamed protein product [Homo sapiens]